MKKSIVNQKKVALYNPYLDILGGGEKHILSILKVFNNFGNQIDIFWDEDLNQKIKKKFGLVFQPTIKFLPNIFKNKKFPFSSIKILKETANYDYFFYVSDGSYFFSLAKKNFIFAMVPYQKLYPISLVNKIKTFNYKIIANSKFTQKFLKKWGIPSIVIEPYIEDDFINLPSNKKDKLILSVGRFFSHLHSKNQDLIIQMFKKIRQRNHSFKDYKLILAGGLKEEDNNYFNFLKKTVANDSSIIFKTNIDYQEILHLYQSAKYYWHFTGFGIDEKKSPEKVEHFGIAPLEAMAAGCCVVSYAGGRMKDLITDKENGFLFKNENEFIKKINDAEKNTYLYQKITENGKEFVKKNFSYHVFKNKVIKSLL